MSISDDALIKEIRDIKSILESAFHSQIESIQERAICLVHARGSIKVDELALSLGLTLGTTEFLIKASGCLYIDDSKIVRETK